jgi:hypothetical protein
MPEDMLPVQLSCTNLEFPPVPVKEMVTGLEFVALLVMARLPETAPVVAGANLTDKTAAWPGAREVPLAIPAALNPVPVTVIP